MVFTLMTHNLQPETMAALAEVWALSPNMRLGELLALLNSLGETQLGKSLEYIEDDEILAVLQRYKKDILNHGLHGSNG